MIALTLIVLALAVGLAFFIGELHSDKKHAQNDATAAQQWADTVGGAPHTSDDLIRMLRERGAKKDRNKRAD